MEHALNQKHTVGIVPEMRYSDLLSAARDGSEKLKGAIRDGLFWPDKSGTRGQDFVQVGGEMAQIATTTGPDEMTRSLIRIFTQAAAKAVHIGMVYGRDYTEKTKVDFDVGAADTVKANVDIDSTRIASDKLDDATRLLTEGVKRAFPQALPEPEISPRNQRKLPSPARIPLPAPKMVR